MFGFDLAQVRHTLHRHARNHARLRAKVFGAELPTVETPSGRAAIVRDLQWANALGLEVRPISELKTETS
ncbi:MAG: hypothetical protein RBU21_02830 [FCB group bacterium]|jgi:hypothetical protein|nr:hypothetical protein [FCB group bacterium]